MPFFSNSSKTANRHYLLCPRCLKTQASLSVHLRRVCLKDGSDADVNAIVDKAKHDADQFLILLKLWNISYESAWKLFGEMLGTQPHNLWCFFLFLNIIFRCSPQVLMRQHMCESPPWHTLPIPDGQSDDHALFSDTFWGHPAHSGGWKQGPRRRIKTFSPFLRLSPSTFRHRMEIKTFLAVFFTKPIWTCLRSRIKTL
jgi:hypothetical protein